MKHDIRLTLFACDPDMGQTEDEPQMLRDAVARLRDVGVPAMRDGSRVSGQTIIREVLAGALRDLDALAELASQAAADGVPLRDVVARRLA